MKDLFEHIGDYLEGRLSPANKKAFEAEMTANEELSRAVDNHDVVESALDLMIEDDIRGVMDGMDTEGDTNLDEGNSTLPKGLRSYLIYMGISLGALALAYLIKQTQQPKEEVLYAAYFKPYIQDGNRGSISEIDQLKECDKGHYYLTQEDFSRGLKSLERSVQINEDCPKKEWYLALAYLKNKEVSKAMPLLKSIAENQDSVYRKSAKELLEKLN